MANTPRTFTTEFKQQAVQLATQPGTNASQVARDLGLHPNLLHRWIRQAQSGAAQGRPVFSGRGQPALNEHEQRIKELEREVAVLRQEREILKAAARFFAKESR